MATSDDIFDTPHDRRRLYGCRTRKRTVPPVTIPSKDVPCLVNLPVEIIIKIFEYLPVYYLSRTMTLVCKRFARILSDDTLWKCLLTKTISNNTDVPVLIRHPCNWGLNENRWSCGRDILWRDLAVQLSLVESRWKMNNDKMVMRNFTRPHYAPVDAVKIIGDGTSVISAGRDRLINLWKVNRDTLDLERLLTADRSHDGWVWDVDSCSPDNFYTCGWDSQVYYWMVSDDLIQLSAFDCEKPVMAVSCTRGLVAAGLNIPRIMLIDPRIGLVHQMASMSSMSFNIHRKAITDVLLVPDKNILLSISEDKTLSFFDIRQHRLAYKTIEVTANDSFPRCLGYYREVLYVGDSRGNVHLYSLGADSREMELINVSKKMRVITSIVPHLGGITVGSTDTFVRMIYPSNPPIFLWKERMPGEVTSVDQTNDLLAVSSGPGCVTVFRPLDV